MGMPRQGIGDAEQLNRARDKQSSERLLERLEKYHGELPQEPAEIIKPLSPILNSELKSAWELMQGFDSVFSRIVMIQKMVLMFYPDVTMADLKAPKRLTKVVRPRMLAMHLSKMLTEDSWSKIGSHFGGRDHSTVINAVAKITALARTDTKIAAQIAAITEAAGGAIA